MAGLTKLSLIVALVLSVNFIIAFAKNITLYPFAALDSPLKILGIKQQNSEYYNLLIKNATNDEIFYVVFKGIVFISNLERESLLIRNMKLNLKGQAQSEIAVSLKEFNEIEMEGKQVEIIIFPSRIYLKKADDKINIWEIDYKSMQGINTRNLSRYEKVMGIIKEASDKEANPEAVSCLACRDWCQTDCGWKWIGHCRINSCGASSFYCNESQGECHYTCLPADQCC